MAVLSGVLNATGFKESWDVIEQATPQSPLKDSAYFVSPLSKLGFERRG